MLKIKKIILSNNYSKNIKLGQHQMIGYNRAVKVKYLKCQHKL